MPCGALPDGLEYHEDRDHDGPDVVEVVVQGPAATHFFSFSF
jgi:hypothetical protein